MSKKDFFAKLKTAKAQEAFREGRAGRGGGFIEVEDGDYVVRFESMELDVTEDGTPYVHINTIVVQAEDNDDLGLRAAQRNQIKAMSGVVDKPGSKNHGKEWEITEAHQFAEVCTALIGFGVETDEMEVADLDEVGTRLEEEQPACRIKVKTNKKDFKYIVWGKFIEDDDIPAIEDVLDEEDDEEGDDDAGDEESTDDGDGDSGDDEGSEGSDDGDEPEEEEGGDEDGGDEPLPPPKKGEELDAQPARTQKVEKYKVKSVNTKAETCTLTRLRDKKEFKAVPWDKIFE